MAPQPRPRPERARPPAPGPAPGPPCSKTRPPRSGPPDRAEPPAARTVPRPAPAPPSPWPPRAGALLASPTAARPGAARGPGPRGRRARAHFRRLREDGQQPTSGSQPAGTLAPRPPHSQTGPPATLRRRNQARASVLGATATEGGPGSPEGAGGGRGPAAPRRLHVTTRAPGIGQAQAAPRRRGRGLRRLSDGNVSVRAVAGQTGCRSACASGNLVPAYYPGYVHIEKADIYFLIDGSGSIHQDDFLAMKVFMNEVIRMFHVGPDGVQFGVVHYTDKVSCQFTLSQRSSVAGLEVAVDSIRQKREATKTGEALGSKIQVFADTARSNVPWYLIVVTDGKSMDPGADAAEALRGHGVTIYAVGVRDANIVELQEVAEDRMFFVHDFESLKAIQQEVVQDICSSETCKNRKTDIIFLMDGSESISPKDFEKMKEFMKRMVKQSNIGADEIQIGLLQFSSDSQEEFRLNRYTSKVDVHRAISDVMQINGGTYPGKALNFTLTFFGSSRGGRPSVHQYLIVVTDGVSGDNVAIPAKALRDRNIIIFAIGVGKVEFSQLLEITNDLSKVYYEEKFESLQNL